MRGLIQLMIAAIILLAGDVFARTEIIVQDSGSETKEFVSSRAARDAFVTIKHQPTRFYYTHAPQEFVIMNYASSRNRLRGDHRTEARQELDEEAQPWIKQELVKQQRRVNKKELELSYNAAGGYVEYIVSFKYAKKLKHFNAMGGTMRGTASVVRFGLEVGDKIYYYDYDGLADEWQELSIPFGSFSDFPLDQAGMIKSFRLMIIGKDQANPEGKVFIDELKVYKYSQKDLERLKEIMEAERVQDSSTFVKELYSQRESF